MVVYIVHYQLELGIYTRAQNIFGLCLISHEFRNKQGVDSALGFYTIFRVFYGDNLKKRVILEAMLRVCCRTARM